MQPGAGREEEEDVAAAAAMAAVDEVEEHSEEARPSTGQLGLKRKSGTGGPHAKKPPGSAPETVQSPFTRHSSSGGKTATCRSAL